jgi:hypothetical protein
MNSSTKRTIRLGLTVGLSLGAIVGIVGCADQMDGTNADEQAAIQSENGFNFNGMAFNGFNFNGFSFNGFSYNGMNFNGMAFNGMNYNGMAFNGMSYNGMSFNGLATTGGLSSTTGLMTTEGGRQFIDYMVKVGYPAGHTLTKTDQYGNSYTFTGALGVAPEIETGSCDTDCQEKLSAALLAHVNNSGLHVGIWLVGPDTGIGWGTSPNFPFQEAAYFGNLFAGNIPGNYCSGKGLGAGDSKGRLGSPFGNNNAIMNAPYLWTWDNSSNQNVPQACVQSGTTRCTVGGPANEGFSSCWDPGANRAWNHVVTVYRNFEPTMLYRICNKNGGKCLGVVGGATGNANVEQRAYDGSVGQTWTIAQVSNGLYKIINKSSGLSLDVSGTNMVQRPYAGQAFSVSYFADQSGFGNIKKNGTSSYAWTNWSTNDGALVTTIDAGQASADAAKWSFTAVGPIAIDPGKPYKLAPKHAPTKALDVCNDSQTNGTCVQQYDSWNGPGQKLVLKDAGKGNVKLTMKDNKNKCVGPKGHAKVAGTKLEVQDCTGGDDQAFITGETAAGSGVFMLKVAGAPGLCLDVTGASTANGAAMQIMSCTGQDNQLFGASISP